MCLSRSSLESASISSSLMSTGTNSGSSGSPAAASRKRRSIFCQSAGASAASSGSLSDSGYTFSSSLIICVLPQNLELSTNICRPRQKRSDAVGNASAKHGILIAQRRKPCARGMVSSGSPVGAALFRCCLQHYGSEWEKAAPPALVLCPTQTQGSRLPTNHGLRQWATRIPRCALVLR